MQKFTKIYILDKQGLLEATVEYALRREDLKDGFMEYLKGLSEKEQDKE